MKTGAVVLAAVVLVGCGEPPRATGIVLITLDTTRADRLGCYGYDRAATPHLDALAREAVIFREAQAPVPVTLPSHASMFTGLYPPRHGIRYNGMFRLEESSVTVAELLHEAGWETAGVPSAFPLSERTGIAQGFATYEDMFRDLFRAGATTDLRIDSERSASEVTEIGTEFLRKERDRPFFLWLHYWAPHYPYRPPFPFSARFHDRPYDGEIAYMDEQVGKLFDAVRESGLWDRIVVIVAGDHGEGLYDHGEKMHSNLVYQSTLRVPLIIKAPGGSPGVLDEPVSLVDIAPTILDFAGVEEVEMEGVSLKPVVLGRTEVAVRDIYFESLAGSLVYGWSPLEGVRRGKWKYVRSSGEELFDLDDDPLERQNVESVYEDVRGELERSLASKERSWREVAAPAKTSSTPVDQHSLDILAALGYLGGFVTEDRRSGPHPKDLVRLELEIFSARSEMGSQEFGAAERRLNALLSEDPSNRLALNMAAQAAIGQGAFDRALEYARRGLELYPEYTPIRIQEGELRVRDGDIAGAAESFRAGLEYHPEDVGLNYRLAVALYALDRHEEAREIVNRMIKAGVQSPSLPVLQAACRARAGEGEAALDSLRQAIAAGYREREVLATEPLLEPLRSVPGFEDVIASIPES